MEFSPTANNYPVGPEEDGLEMTEAPTVEEMLQELPPIPDNLRGDPVPPGVKRVVEEKDEKSLQRCAEHHMRYRLQEPPQQTSLMKQ